MQSVAGTAWRAASGALRKVLDSKPRHEKGLLRTRERAALRSPNDSCSAAQCALHGTDDSLR